MQKTGWTIHSFFLVLSGLKKSFTLDVITRGQSITIFLCIGPFLVTNERTNKQPGDPRASLLLTSEKAVFCIYAGLHKLWYPVVRDMSTWSKFGAHGEHGDVFLFSNLGAL